MKVKELIKELQKLDQDREIYTLGYDDYGEYYCAFISKVLSIKEHNKVHMLQSVEMNGYDEVVDGKDYILLD
ncbi:hypothetical protein [Clostridium perfringens]|uniref:hypothetical protein n=1 Tax=Clostridium perfringens TaxID=1502 RepID=UPI00096A8018|nr:hypothetical protein [Clostridium perfringens]